MCVGYDADLISDAQMTAVHRHDTVARLFRTALRAGAERLSMSTIEWDAAGDCLSPVPTEFHGRPDAKLAWHRKDAHPIIVGVDAWGDVLTVPRKRPLVTAAKSVLIEPSKRPSEGDVCADAGAVSLTVIIHARCRKCARCLSKRAAMWRYRCKAEIAMANRSWFGTLTFSPERQHYWLSVARSSARNYGCVDYDTLDADDQWSLRVRATGEPITRMLKRIRASGHVFRYYCVVEKHASGDPHFHVLIHEWGEAITGRELESQWREGFSHWRVAPREDLRAATYVTKYLTKSEGARVRASRNYGRGLLLAKDAKAPVRASALSVDKAREAMTRDGDGSEGLPPDADSVGVSLLETAQW